MFHTVGRTSSAPLLPAAYKVQFVAGSIPALIYFFYCLQSEISLILNDYLPTFTKRKQETVFYLFIYQSKLYLYLVEKKMVFFSFLGEGFGEFSLRIVESTSSDTEI